MQYRFRKSRKGILLKCKQIIYVKILNKELKTNFFRFFMTLNVIKKKKKNRIE